MSTQSQSSSPLPFSRPTPRESSSSKIPENWPCSCGTGDGSGDYIQCDNEDCRVGWYHWGCVRVTEEPAGTWLCPSCSPNAAFYIKQLAKSRAAPPPIPRPGKLATASTSRGKVHVPKPVKTGTPTSSKKKEQMPETKNERPAKKGTAFKKSAPQKPKPKWVGWVEMSSDEEEDFKKKVNAKFMMKDGVMGKRRRASRVAAENNETSSRGLGTRARAGERKNVVEMDSVEEEETHSESVHQQAEEDEEGEKEEGSVSEASGREKASVIEISSNDSSSEDTMEIDEVTDEEADKDSADETSDRPLDPKEGRHISPDRVLGQTTVPSDRHDEEDFPEAAPKDLEGSMDIEVEQHESVEASISDRDRTEGSENMDDDHASAPSRTPLDISRDRDVIDLSSPSPKSTSATRSASPSAALPHDQIVISDDSTDVDADREGQEGQIFVTVTPAVQYNHNAALYQHRKNYWADFPESALRSTLPRLA